MGGETYDLRNPIEAMANFNPYLEAFGKGIMGTGVQLDKMTTADKLRALEEIWADLQRNPEDVPAPAWHGDVLRAREAREKEGVSQFGGWTEAKARIRERTK